MTNWKNVNNWHWVDKNCFPWAKSFFEEKFGSIKESDEEGSIAIEKVTKLEGEVDVNQRKGKIMYFYDLSMELAWTRSLQGSDSLVKGSLVIPEFSNEESAQACDISVKLDNNADSSSDKSTLEKVKKTLIPHVRQVMESFLLDLERIHGTSIQVPASNSGSMANSNNGSTSNSNANLSSTVVAPSSSSNGPVVVVTETLHETITFSAPKDIIYDVFSDPAKVQGWTRGSANWTPQVNSNFTFFGGNVQGTVVELVPGEKIALTWRLASWPKAHSSIVVLTFAADPKAPSHSCLLTLSQSNVPRSDLVETKANWFNYYFNPIKNLFGF